MSLTTPVIRDEDNVFPGESWFFYWKTSASLWESKIMAMGKEKVLFVPVNWSFHSDTGDRYDFAQEKPETDLARLVSIATKCHKKVVFLFPLTPFPFLPNGGVPTFLARVPSLDRKGKMISAVDREGVIYKMFSFFDTRVYKAYCKFAKTFGQYVTTAGIDADVWGVDCGVTTDNGFASFFDDRSQTFFEGFSLYLQEKRSELASGAVASAIDEHLLQEEFTQMIRSLYVEQVKMACHAHFEGTFKVSFIGADSSDFFQRVYGQDSLAKYSYDTLESLSLDAVPSSVLLPSRVTRGVLGRMLQQLVTCSYVENLMSEKIYEEEGSSLFRMKRYFEVYDLTKNIDPNAIGWADLGLWDFLQTNYSWCYADRGSDYYECREGQDNNVIRFFHGITVDETLFRHILKTFMSGGQVILNRSGLSDDLLRRLEAFFLENNLNVEKVHYQTTIFNVSLGDGRFIVFEGDKLIDLDPKSVDQFWERLISTFHLSHIQVAAEGVSVVWSYRSSDHNELNYEEVRRASFYNPTSYKKKVTLKLNESLKLVKIVDEHQVTYKHGPQDIIIDMMPEGSISFDFGVLP